LCFGLGLRWGFGLLLRLLRRIGSHQWLELLFSGGLGRDGRLHQPIEESHDHHNTSEPKRNCHHQKPHLQEGILT
jgi:hypothetical protein